MRPITSVLGRSIDAAMRVMLENRVQILTVEEEFAIIDLVTMEDVETLSAWRSSMRRT